MKSKEVKRDQKTGRYTDSQLDKVCTCSHTLGDHTAAKVGTEQPCLVEGCGCEMFRKYRERCGSGWTNDRCSKWLGHRGLHSNE